ncbi:MAG: CPBP family intramembrane metalloprotease [Bacteroidota bacterium]|nr:CPBP family intramembrane metalloprotease [Bacteroidota bacterium]
MNFLERHNISPVLFSFISLIILFTTYQIIGGALAYLFFQGQINEQTVNGIRWLTVFSQIIFLLVPTILLTKLASTNIRDYLRFKSTSLIQIILAMFGMFALGQMLQVYLTVQDMIPLPESIQPFVESIKKSIEQLYKQVAGASNIQELFFVLFVIAVVPAFAEEFLFRGLVQRSLERGLTPLKGVIFTGIIFGAFHLNPFTFVPLAIIGIYLGFLVLKSGSLMVPIAAHFFNNAIAVFAIYLKYDEDALITGKPSAMSPEILLLSFVFFLLVFFIIMYYFIRASNLLTKIKSEV